MNIYEVLSETLIEIVWEDWFNNVGHEEPYRIAHLVVAHTPLQAKYLAWKTHSDFTYDLSDMPKFSVHICCKNVNLLPGIVTDDKKFQHCWRDYEEEKRS